MNFVVCWQFPSGARGHSEPMMEVSAKAWADEGNRKYPEARHWVEPAALPAGQPSEATGHKEQA